MAERKKQSFLQGALILSLAAVLTKVIGALFFKIPLKNLNSTAYGYFEATYNVYVPIYTVCTAGFPTAVSRMVSESIALGRYRDVKTIFRVAFRVFLVTGLVGTLLMLGLSSFYPGVRQPAEHPADHDRNGAGDPVLLSRFGLPRRL